MYCKRAKCRCMLAVSLLLQLQALDVWGNPTCPNDLLPFEVMLQCAATDPGSGTFQVDDR